MRNLIIGIISVIAIWFILNLFGINSTYVIPNSVEWATKFILPWIILYWLIRLVKNLEKNNQ
ncbi:hypothetical protein J6TS2_26600 [Heyndrickxia sporothermodurans]|nr:hypothetical protein J6TS2_26600 [Heyndrickxia sporothermodurans]